MENIESKINDSFKLPITFVNHEDISDSMNIDLELSKSLENNKTLYDLLLTSTTNTSKPLIDQWSKYYTNNVDYLKQSQTLYKNVKLEKMNTNMDHMVDCLNTIYNNEEFDRKYDYINIEYFTSLNTNIIFLWIMSIYTLMSPLTYILTPIYLLLIPLLSQGGYACNLLKNLSYTSIARLFTCNNNKERMYHIGYILFFGLRMFINIRGCYTFYKNLNQIQHELTEIKIYVDEYLMNINKLNEFITVNKLTHYELFQSNIQLNIHEMTKLQSNLKNIKLPIFIFYDYNHLGDIRSIYYELKHNEKLKSELIYSLGLYSYFDNIIQIKDKIEQQLIQKCEYTNKTSFVNSYYPFIHDPVKNSFEFKNNYIITGPNASGKTTFIKSTMINILLSQQIGYGYYDSATISVYDKLCCYLNIPDSSNRDSLFQAEARRCKEMLDIIETNNTMCIFDELFSGTNPLEATACSYAFLKHITNKCQFLLTTHFIDICDKLNDHIENYHMEIEDQIYTYKLVQGKSNIKGGIDVLKKMNFPETMIDDANSLIDAIK